MTPDEMRATATECEKIARALADHQDRGLFTPRPVAWSGTITTETGPAPAQLVVTKFNPDGTFVGNLTVNGVIYALDAAATGTVIPAIGSQLANRIVNATLSAANTFNYLADRDAPKPAGS